MIFLLCCSFVRIIGLIQLSGLFTLFVFGAFYENKLCFYYCFPFVSYLCFLFLPSSAKYKYNDSNCNDRRNAFEKYDFTFFIDVIVNNRDSLYTNGRDSLHTNGRDSSHALIVSDGNSFTNNGIAFANDRNAGGFIIGR